MKISVCGTGYVGLVVGASFAEGGHDVTCVDIDEKKIAKLQDGILPIFEPRFDELVKRNIKHGRLHFTTDIEKTAKECLVNFITVGTPSLDNWEADVESVLVVARAIGRAMEDYKVIVIKSTVSVGTAERVKTAMKEVTDVPFDIVANPEFLRAGGAVDDFMKPDRIIIGTETEKAEKVMRDLYAPFAGYAKQFLAMDIRSAEITKYAANAMLATRISFMNELANLCEKLGCNIDDVRRGIGSDERIGYAFLFPGIGYGGSCFPKDTRALLKMGDRTDSPLTIIEAVDRVNRRQADLFFAKICRHFETEHLDGKTFAVWGISFKPNTDDTRESPAINTIRKLIHAGAKVRACDPEAVEAVRPMFADKEKAGKIEYFTEPYDMLEGCDALVLCTEWPEFRNPDLVTLKQSLKNPVVFDGRNVLDPKALVEQGFTYYGVGLGKNGSGLERIPVKEITPASPKDTKEKTHA